MAIMFTVDNVHSTKVMQNHLITNSRANTYNFIVIAVSPQLVTHSIGDSRNGMSLPKISGKHQNRCLCTQTWYHMEEVV